IRQFSVWWSFWLQRTSGREEKLPVVPQLLRDSRARLLPDLVCVCVGGDVSLRQRADQLLPLGWTISKAVQSLGGTVVDFDEETSDMSEVTHGLVHAPGLTEDKLD